MKPRDLCRGAASGSDFGGRTAACERRRAERTGAAAPPVPAPRESQWARDPGPPVPSDPRVRRRGPLTCPCPFIAGSKAAASSPVVKGSATRRRSRDCAQPCWTCARWTQRHAARAGRTQVAALGARNHRGSDFTTASRNLQRRIDISGMSGRTTSNERASLGRGDDFRAGCRRHARQPLSHKTTWTPWACGEPHERSRFGGSQKPP